MRKLTATVLLFSVAPLAAQARPFAVPPVSADELAGYLPEGAKVEARLEADVTGDGRPDTVVVGGNEDERRVVVLQAIVTEVDFGHAPVGTARLDPGPLGPATLRLARGVLIVEDLTGGTTAVSSLYRYRFDPAQGRMRLIGDDVTLYSRTYAHGSTKVSTNRLTGARNIEMAEADRRPGSAAAMLPPKVTTRTVSRAPVWMEDAPNPDDTLESAHRGRP